MDNNNKYVKVKPLGKGSFGSAMLIRRKSDGQHLVVKEVNLSKMSTKEREEARNECKVLQSLNHPNIVRYVEHYELRGVLYIVMEYADGGDLAQKIKETGGRGMKEPTVMYYFSQLCLALEYLHSRHILHRDIKTMNIFLMKNGSVKLGDFGISTILRNTMGMANTVCGTPYYFSPELCKNRPYNNRSDVWAMGVVLYEMMTGKHPYDANSMQQLMQRIVKHAYAPVSTVYSKDLRQLLDMCLQKEPMRRPNIKQMLAHPSVRGALEKLETDLMLATQCRVRLQDIIDFPAKASGRAASEGRSSSNANGVSSSSPSNPSLRPSGHQAPNDQVILRNDPRHVARPSGGNVSPRRAAGGAGNSPPVSALRRPSGSPPPKAAVANQLKADLDRVDAFIRQLNQPVNDRAKDAIQEYMKRKQDELAAQKKREEEMRRKQEERRVELRKIMEDHQKQMLEHAKLKLQRVQQQYQHQPPAHLPSAAAPPAAQHQTPNVPNVPDYGSPPKRVRAPPPSALRAIYGQPSPAKKNVKHVLAANSPANAKRFQPSPAPSARQMFDMAPAHQHFVPPSPQPQQAPAPQPRPAAPHQPPPMPNVPKHQVVERAQNWADRQAERKRQEIEGKQNRKLEDERRLVRELDALPVAAKSPATSEQLAKPVVDPNLAAWVRRTSSLEPEVSARRNPQHSNSPPPRSYGSDSHHEVPAGVEARRRLSNVNSEVQRHAAAVDVVFRDQRMQVDPTTPPSDRPVALQDFRRYRSDGAESVPSRSSSASSERLRLLRPSEIPQAVENVAEVQQRTAPHQHLGAPNPRNDIVPIVRYAATTEFERDEEEGAIAVPEIIRSMRDPSTASSHPDTSGTPESDVPVEAYAAMLTHLKVVLEKKPVSGAAARHQMTILDADSFDDVEEGACTPPIGESPRRGDGSVLETEAFMLGDEEGDDVDGNNSDDDDDDFEDEEALTPIHVRGVGERGTNDGDDGTSAQGSDDVDETDLAHSFFLRHLCGDGFRGHMAVHPTTGIALIPSGSVSRQTNEFQLRVMLEKRLSVAGLDAITLQLEALPVGSPMEGRVLDEIRGTVAVLLAKVKRCPTAALHPQEASNCLALCAQLLFFQDESD